MKKRTKKHREFTEIKRIIFLVKLFAALFGIVLLKG